MVWQKLYLMAASINSITRSSEELQVNSRISVADLARKIHLSPPAVHQRIKRLERAGVIQQYVALLNREMIGYDLLCFIQVSIQPHTQSTVGWFSGGDRGITRRAGMLSHRRKSRSAAESGGAGSQRTGSLHQRPPDDHSGVERIEASPVLNEMKARRHSN